MLKFLVFKDGRSAKHWPLRNVYLTGADGSAVRAEVGFGHGVVACHKHEPGTAALHLQHEAGDLGELTLQTCLLPDRQAPYVLTLELARHRLMMLYTKLEDWGMFDLDEDHPVNRRAETARKLFIEALCIQRDDPIEADRLSHQCLVIALDGSEELSLAHSELLLNRRKSSHVLPKMMMGCGVSTEHAGERFRAGLKAAFDYAHLPTTWRDLAPSEGEYNWRLTDSWADWLGRHRMPTVAGPLLSFEPNHPPDWLYIWEHDFETVRDLAYEHIERVVERYKNVVTSWNVVSGLHVNQHFTFNFEQLMDLTRMATMLVKKITPQAAALIEIRQPFGEYYSTSSRSIPPMMYADLVTQSGITFDGFLLRLLMGQARPGQYVRDLMQVSNLLDEFAVFDKPIYLDVAVPSHPVTAMMLADPDAQTPIDADCGYWRRPWSPGVQSHWLEAALQVAMSKPFVEGVAWHDFVDHLEMDLPLGGLISEEMVAKPALKRLISFRRSLLGLNGTSTEGAGTKHTSHGHAPPESGMSDKVGITMTSPALPREPASPQSDAPTTGGNTPQPPPLEERKEQADHEPGQEQGRDEMQS